MGQLENREWKPIEGYEGIYDLRDDGLIYSHPRKYCKGGYSYGKDTGNGYFKFSLSKNQIVKTKQVHILVYETFVGEIPKGYDVHHINHNGLDNRVENLCLMEKHKHRKMHYEENKKDLNKAMVNKLSKPVIQYTLEGEFVAEYQSAREAERQTGIYHTHISNCCKNKYGFKSAGGFVWKYK